MNDSHRSELKARYATAVASGNRMLTWWLVLLFVLAVVVEQQIRDRQVKTDELKRDLRSAHESGRAARKEMGLAYGKVHGTVQGMIRCDTSAIRTALRGVDGGKEPICTAGPESLSAWWGRFHADTSLLRAMVAFEPSRLARRYADTVEVTDSLAAMARRLGVPLDGRGALHTFPASLDGGGAPPEPVSRSDGVPLLARPDPAVSGEAAGPGGAAVQPAAAPEPPAPDALRSDAADARRTEVSALAAHLLAYRAAFDKYARARSGVSASVAELKKLSAEQQSLPTPFGGFNLAPRLALLGLAAGALATYLVFLRTAAEARRIALRYHAQAGEPISTPPGAPAWVYGGDPGLPASVGWSDDALPGVRWRALLAHGAWIAIATWLVFDVQTLEASEALRIPLGRFAGPALMAVLLLAVALATLAFRGPRMVRPDVGGGSPRGLSRRTFVASTAAAVLAGALGLAWLVARGWAARKAPKPSLDLGELVATRPGWWFVNARTGAVHCEPLCGGHLGGSAPLRQNHPLAPGARLHLHEGKEALILEAVSLAVVRSGDVAGAIRWLQKAIEFEPFSYRLYDRLVRLFGTTRQYHRIVPLLESGLARTDSLSEAARKKARAEFQRRIDFARSREAARARRNKTPRGPSKL